MTNKKGVIMNKKRIAALFTAMATMLSSLNIASAKSIVNHTAYQKLIISGFIPISDREENIYNSRSVNITLKNNGEIVFVDEEEIDNDGNYEMMIRLNDDYVLSECTLNVKIGNKSAESTVVSAVVVDESLLNIPVITDTIDGVTEISADFTDVSIMSDDDYKVILATYDTDGKLQNMEFIEDRVVKNGNSAYLNYKFDGEYSAVRLFVWQSLKSMMPMATTSTGAISFGEQYRKQEINGYQDLKVTTNYDRYAAAKSEISNEAKIAEVPYITSRMNIYVSPDGAEDGNGSLENPYNSIQQALDAIKTYTDDNKKVWKTIYLRGGDYYINDTVTIDESIASDGDARLVIKPYNNEKVTFTNAKTVLGSQFKKVTAENTEASEYARLNQEAVENIYYCDYENLGCTTVDDFANGSPGRTPTLEYNGINANISRFPNEGSSDNEGTVNGEVNIKEIIESGEAATLGVALSKPVFKPTDTKFTTWKNPDNKIGMYGQLCVSWSINSSLIEIDKENGTIILPAGLWGWYNTDSYTGIKTQVGYDPPVNSHFYYYNILEELDLPYEWCAEDSQQRLYFYPPNGELADSDVIAIKTNKGKDNMFAVSGVKNVMIDGIDFKAGKTAVNISGCENVIVSNSLIKNTVSGVKISNSQKCGIVNSELLSVSSGVSLSDSNEAFQSLTSSRNFVQNNHFNNTRYAINISSNGNIISHNMAENYEGTMIFITAGCENIIEYNESIAGAQKGEEGGIVYVGGQFNCRHNHIRYNYFHHNEIPGETKRLAGAIVLDDLGEAEYVYGNVIECVNSGIGANGGDNHVIDDNFVVDTRKPIGFAGQYATTNGYGAFTKYFMTGDLPNSQYLRHYYDMDLQNSEAWNERYPYLQESLSWFEHIGTLWTDYRYDTNEDIKFFVNQTGLIVTDNVIEKGEGREYESEYYYMMSEYKEEVDVKNGEKPSTYGDTNLEYCAEYNNAIIDSYDMKQVLSEKLNNNFGLKNISPQYFEADRKITITNESGTDGILTGDKLSCSWIKRSDANYYVVTVARDAQFNDIAAEYKTFKTGCEIDLKTSGTYYYKVEGVSMKFDNFGKVMASSNEE